MHLRGGGSTLVGKVYTSTDELIAKRWLVADYFTNRLQKPSADVMTFASIAANLMAVNLNTHVGSILLNYSEKMNQSLNQSIIYFKS